MTNEAPPILYTAIYQKRDGHEGSIDFDEPGWLNKFGLSDAMIFSLEPKPGAPLPRLSIHLTPLPDGTPRELVFFTRVFGRFGANGDAGRPLFRIYCIGWKAMVGGRELLSVFFVYPSGSIVSLAGESAADLKPPYVDDLLDYYERLAGGVTFKPTPIDVSVNNVRYRLCDEVKCRALATVKTNKQTEGIPAVLFVERQLCGKHARQS